VMLDARHDVVDKSCISCAMAILISRCAIRCFDCLCIPGSYAIRYRRVLRSSLRKGQS
ncbi:hypothetical protein M436DRAFT_59075, partial [Aureobasidium namibiae CBS 147.97]